MLYLSYNIFINKYINTINKKVDYINKKIVKFINIIDNNIIKKIENEINYLNVNLFDKKNNENEIKVNDLKIELNEVELLNYFYLSIIVIIVIIIFLYFFMIKKITDNSYTLMSNIFKLFIISIIILTLIQCVFLYYLSVNIIKPDINKIFIHVLNKFKEKKLINQ
jgi:hypothetical protein